MDRVLIDRQELERLKALEKKLILEQRMKELSAVDYPPAPKVEPQYVAPAVTHSATPVFQAPVQSQNPATANQNNEIQTAKMEMQIKEKDEVEKKVEQMFEMQNKKENEIKIFKNPLIKKKIPQSQAQEKFNKWLEESCKNNCFVCDDCEKKLRQIINEAWEWFQKIESN